MCSKYGVYFYCTAYCDAHFILSSSSICFSQQVTELEKGLTLISEEQGRVLFFSPRPPTNLLLVFSSVLCCPQDKRGDKQVRGLSGREEPRAENMSELLCVFFVNIHTNYIFFCVGYQVSVAGGVHQRDRWLGMTRCVVPSSLSSFVF